MNFAHSKLHLPVTFSRFVTFAKSNVMAKRHCFKSLFISLYCFLMTFVTFYVKDKLYIGKNKNRGIGNIKFKFTYIRRFEIAKCHDINVTPRQRHISRLSTIKQKGDCL